MQIQLEVHSGWFRCIIMCSWGHLNRFEVGLIGFFSLDCCLSIDLFIVVGSLGIHLLNPLIGFRNRAKQSDSVTMHWTPEERGAPLIGCSMSLGRFWNVGIALVEGIASVEGISTSVDACGDWSVDHGWDSDVVCWASWDKSEAIACILPMSINTWWVRFRSISTGMSKWLKFISNDERPGLLNRR